MHLKWIFLYKRPSIKLLLDCVSKSCIIPYEHYPTPMIIIHIIANEENITQKVTRCGVSFSGIRRRKG